MCVLYGRGGVLQILLCIFLAILQKSRTLWPEGISVCGQQYQTFLLRAKGYNPFWVRAKGYATFWLFSVRVRQYRAC